MPTPKTVQELNRELGEKLADDGCINPQAPYYGKFVGIANGQVVVVADNWDEVMHRLRLIEPDPTRCYGVEVGRDYSEVEYIWGFA